MVDLKELKKLIKYLRKEGITEFKADGIEFKLGNLPSKLPRLKKFHPIPDGQVDVSDQVNIETNEPSREELLFWSAGGVDTNPKEDN